MKEVLSALGGVAFVIVAVVGTHRTKIWWVPGALMIVVAICMIWWMQMQAGHTDSEALRFDTFAAASGLAGILLLVLTARARSRRRRALTPSIPVATAVERTFR